MKTLLAYIYNNFEFLYLNPQYRITDSSTDGNPTVNATLRFSGPSTSFWFGNDRGQVTCALAPAKIASQENWFRLAIVRQYLEGLDETTPILGKDAARWVAENLAGVEDLFTDDAVARSCAEMTALERISADKRFGPA